MHLLFNSCTKLVFRPQRSMDSAFPIVSNATKLFNLLEPLTSKLKNLHFNDNNINCINQLWNLTLYRRKKHLLCTRTHIFTCFKKFSYVVNLSQAISSKFSESGRREAFPGLPCSSNCKSCIWLIRQIVFNCKLDKFSTKISFQYQVWQIL